MFECEFYELISGYEITLLVLLALIFSEVAEVVGLSHVREYLFLNPTSVSCLI